jgi:hypothetical protein
MSNDAKKASKPWLARAPVQTVLVLNLRLCPVPRAPGFVDRFPGKSVVKNMRNYPVLSRPFGDLAIMVGVTVVRLTIRMKHGTESYAVAPLKFQTQILEFCSEMTNQTCPVPRAPTFADRFPDNFSCLS